MATAAAPAPQNSGTRCVFAIPPTRRQLRRNISSGLRPDTLKNFDASKFSFSLCRTQDRTASANGLPRLPAYPTPYGRTVNCAPVHRYAGGSLPEILPWLQHPPQILPHSLSCMPMQRRKNYQGRFAGFQAGKGRFSRRRPQDRAEGVCGGAAKRCYGKFDCVAGSDTKKTARGRPLPILLYATIRYLFSSAVM